MFGQQDNQSDPQNAQIPEQSIDGVLGAGPAPSDNSVAPLDPSWQHPGAPLDQVLPPTPPPAAPSDTPQSTNPFGAPSPDASDSSPSVDGTGQPSDLASIKQQALGQLSPLVSHLDQAPEEKFRTLMMMIQAGDDQTKLPDAYQAAQAITDEKARAQALLDVVNEINYFTQQHAQ